MQIYFWEKSIHVHYRDKEKPCVLPLLLKWLKYIYRPFSNPVASLSLEEVTGFEKIVSFLANTELVSSFTQNMLIVLTAY